MHIPFLSYIYIPHSPEYIVHIPSEDLILHKRTLEPSKTLIYSLREYDKDRCTARLDPYEAAHTKVVGFMSMKATIYLADVLDHMEHILTSLDMYEAMVENLVNFTFNVCFHGICSRLQQDIYYFIDDLQWYERSNVGCSFLFCCHRQVLTEQSRWRLTSATIHLPAFDPPDGILRAQPFSRR